MKNIRDILFEILRASVFGTDAREKFREEKFSQEELEALYQLASAHDLAHIVGFALEKNESIKAYPIAKKIEKAYLFSVFRRERLDWECDRVCALLESEAIFHIPLKGALLRTLYPETWMRTSSDIDVLVKQEDLERSVAAAKEKLSYEEKGPRLNHDVPLYSPNGVHCELHFCIREGMEPMDTVLDTVWEYASPEKEGTYRCRMTEEFFLFHQITHAAYHFIKGGCGIRTFMDLYLLKQKYSYDEKKLLSLLKCAKLDAFYYSCIALSEVWFGKDSHSSITREMEKYLLGGGVHGTMENQIAMAQSKKEGKARYLWNRVFMPMRSLRIYYPGLKKYPFLYPLYQVRRWFRIVFGSSRKRAMQEFAHNADLNQSKVDQATFLRQTLGLE